MGKSKKAVERRVEPLVLHSDGVDLTDRIGVAGHVRAWEIANNLKRMRDRKTGGNKCRKSM